MISARELKQRTGGRCPAHDDLHASLSISEKNGKTLVYCHAGCSFEQVTSAFRKMGITLGQNNSRIAAQDSDREKRIGTAQSLWERAKPIEGTKAEQYLRCHRGIDTEFNRRCVKCLPYARAGWQVPCLIVALQNGSNEVTAVQLTYLDPDTGEKAEASLQRQTFGYMGDGAVKLRTVSGSDLMGLAEGVESGLSAMELYDIPTWAVLSASRLGAIAIPPHIKRITIFGDNDKPGLEAARRAAYQYRARGFEVSIRRPAVVGDYNDLLLEDKRG